MDQTAQTAGHEGPGGALARSQDRPLLAAVWMLGSIVSFTAMAIAIRAVKDRHEVFEILAYRSVVGFVFVLVLATALGRLNRISAKRLPGHILRNVVHFTGQGLWILAVTMIPMAQVFALEFTSPIWMMLMSPLILGERLSRTRILAALIGFGGVLLVAQPDFARPDLGVMAGAACAVFFAATMILTRRLTRQEDLFSILFWLTLLQAFIAFGLALRDGAITPPDLHSLPWLVVIGLSGVIGHLCLTTALSLAPATVVGPMDFLRLPVIAVIGASFYSEPLSLGLAFGGALILLGNWISIRSESLAKKGIPATAPPP